MNKKVMVAMSGGVDSSVCAALLKNQGYEVIGATLKIWDSSQCTEEKKKSCCSLKDIEDARRSADILGIRHYVLDAVEIFNKQVIDYFLSEYLNGRTPNPCIICNEKIKFDFMLKKARALGCDFIATGHYVRIINDNGVYRLLKGVDASKDQSYALFGLSQETMPYVLLPLGEYTKQDIRKIAKELGLKVHDKEDSQELCFVKFRDTDGYLADKLKAHVKPGDIINQEAQKVGEHKGICFYTIGQRNRIGAFGKPMYVTHIDKQTNTIEIGGKNDLLNKELCASDIHWTNPEYANKNEFRAEVKIRYKHKQASARVVLEPLREIQDLTLVSDPGSHAGMRVVFDQPQMSITPGQAAVVYVGDEVICGAWIE